MKYKFLIIAFLLCSIVGLSQSITLNHLKENSYLNKTGKLNVDGLETYIKKNTINYKKIQEV